MSDSDVMYETDRRLLPQPQRKRRRTGRRPRLAISGLVADATSAFLRRSHSTGVKQRARASRQAQHLMQNTRLARDSARVSRA